MARFITVEVGCDWADCDERAIEGDGTIVSRTVSIDGKQAREFLLCEPKHREAFEDVVLPLMAAGLAVPTKTSGRPRKSTAGTVGTVGGGLDDADAPVDPDHPGHPHVTICQATIDGRTCNRPIRRRVGMAQHVRKAHGYESLEAYEAEFGPVT